jgi:hypothetical protein
MNKLTAAAALLYLSLFSPTAFSQNSSPAPTPPPDRDVVKISTNLIRIDVSVTDSKGRAVSDLRAEEG